MRVYIYLLMIFILSVSSALSADLNLRCWVYGYKSAVTGEWVTPSFAKENRDVTYRTCVRYRLKQKKD